MGPITEKRGPADWRGSEVADWQLATSDNDRAELLAAVAAAAGLDLAAITADNFPLPTFGPSLTQLADELVNGRGFALLRGLPVEGLTEHQADLLAVGVSGHIGRVTSQPGNVPVMHVRDRGVDPAAPTTRSYQHSGRLGFHSDPYDIVALLCLRPAMAGGLSSVISSVAVHNVIVRDHPELAAALYEP
jgi:hypothetical protein